jgi:hypothetical protein
VAKDQKGHGSESRGYKRGDVLPGGNVVFNPNPPKSTAKPQIATPKKGDVPWPPKDRNNPTREEIAHAVKHGLSFQTAAERRKEESTFKRAYQKMGASSKRPRDT